jgi:hypothetical protein
MRRRRKEKRMAKIILEEKIAIRLQGAYYLTAVKGGGIGDGKKNTHFPFHTDATGIDAWEEFDLVASEFGGWTLKNYFGGYLTILNHNSEPANTLPLHTDATKLAEWEMFTLCKLDNGKVAIRTYTKNYLSAIKLPGLPANSPVSSLEKNPADKGNFNIVLLDWNSVLRPLVL